MRDYGVYVIDSKGCTQKSLRMFNKIFVTELDLSKFKTCCKGFRHWPDSFVSAVTIKPIPSVVSGKVKYLRWFKDNLRDIPEKMTSKSFAIGENQSKQRFNGIVTLTYVIFTYFCGPMHVVSW